MFWLTGKFNIWLCVRRVWSEPSSVCWNEEPSELGFGQKTIITYVCLHFHEQIKN